MKDEEFNLSKKRQDTNKGTNFIRYAYSEEDVKDFIRLLKEVNINIYKINLENAEKSGVSRELKEGILFLIRGCCNEMDLQIDKLVGEKLK